MNLNETIFGTSYMIGVDRSNGKVENINLIDLMDELILPLTSNSLSSPSQGKKYIAWIEGTFVISAWSFHTLFSIKSLEK